MIDLNTLNKFRVKAPDFWGTDGDDMCGVFMIQSPTDRHLLKVIAGNGDGWDHVSVSRQTRCPNWPEMEHIKRLFFKDDEIAFQLHMPPSLHISIHPFVLHIWRPHLMPIPLPPREFV